MKKLLPFLLLFSLTSCTWLEENVQVGCDAVDTITAGVTDVGGFFGAPGNVAAGAINMLLELTCGLVATTAAAPQDLADMISGTEEVTDEVVVDTPPDGH